MVSCASKKAQKEIDDKAFIYYTSGTQSLVAKKYTEALKDLLEAIKLDPKNTEIHNNLAMAYFFKNEHSLAQSHWERAIDLDKTNNDARNNLASLFFTQKKYIEAQKQYEIILSDLTYPNQFRTYYNLGLIENLRNNKTHAKDYFTKAIEENENYCPAYYQLGLMSYETGDFKAAYGHFKNSGIGDCVNNAAESTYYQALTSMKIGNHERAKLKFMDLINNYPDSELTPKAKLQLDRLKNLENSVVHSAIQDDMPKEENKQSFITP